MSYLLTEIALEMLGYKFYDTNGTFHLTNFQNNSTLSESHPDEPSLTEFIEQTNQEPELQQELHTLGLREEADLVADTIPETRNPRRTPAKALAKIMEYESEKIVNQISTRLECSVARRAAEDSDEQIVEIIDEERRLIASDAAVMHKFREFVQSRLQRLDKRPYEKYARTFGPE
ncbi:uncharacterized protein LOC6543398 [Drosophila erecta]|uniref:Uncharacterized protein n=1 Tax=Drosophila erecta TaxID=7220 RepID=B3N9R8_DROER|nr:uncharacterized protein LOC6543398 [Drosophila erecta]EDV58563.1 uncharacterized protein Dere_GG10141 [Drosophila erecta]